MNNQVMLTKREAMIVKATSDGIGGVASGFIVATFLLLVAGFLGLLWSPISAIIILGFVGYNIHKSYKAFMGASLLVGEAYKQPISSEVHTQEEWEHILR